MKRGSFEEMHCSVAQALEQVGEWWSLLIVRDVQMGARRFDEIQGRLGISRNTLTQRLKGLTEHGILEKVERDDGGTEYLLTEKGIELWPVIDALRQWGDRHAAPDGPPIEIVHTGKRGCGHRTNPVLCCSECGEQVDARAIRPVPGPGEVEPLVIAGR